MNDRMVTFGENHIKAWFYLCEIVLKVVKKYSLFQNTLKHFMTHIRWERPCLRERCGKLTADVKLIARSKKYLEVGQ